MQSGRFNTLTSAFTEYSHDIYFSEWLTDSAFKKLTDIDFFEKLFSLPFIYEGNSFLFFFLQRLLNFKHNSIELENKCGVSDTKDEVG